MLSTETGKRKRTQNVEPQEKELILRKNNISGISIEMPPVVQRAFLLYIDKFTT